MELKDVNNAVWNGHESSTEVKGILAKHEMYPTPRTTKSKDNIHIEDSFRYSKKDFCSAIKSHFRGVSFSSPLWERSIRSMELEWAMHNLLYNLHIFRSRTKDVDLDAPQPVIYRVAYWILGSIAWMFIK